MNNMISYISMVIVLEKEVTKQNKKKLRVTQIIRGKEHG